MYQYHDANGEFISLHDCRAAKASLESNILSLYFPEGIDIEAEHPDNPYQQAAYTGEARLDFHLLYRPDVAGTIYIFTEENDTRDIRELYELSQFLNDINNRQYELEFLYTYQGYQTVLYTCWLWMQEPPYHKECYLFISARQIDYYWNEMHAD